jgi:Ca2+/Na+ antiporter
MIILIILGIILVVMSFTLKTDQNPLSKFSNLFKIGILLIVGGIFSSAFKQIDAGTVGVYPYMEMCRLVFYKWSECNQSTS